MGESARAGMPVLREGTEAVGGLGDGVRSEDVLGHRRTGKSARATGADACVRG
jgi:hypothetical protein